MNCYTITITNICKIINVIKVIIFPKTLQYKPIIAFFNIPIYEVSNIDQCLRVLKKEDFWVVALENEASNKNWYEVDYRKKIVIMLGSEG